MIFKSIDIHWKPAYFLQIFRSEIIPCTSTSFLLYLIHNDIVVNEIGIAQEFTCILSRLKTCRRIYVRDFRNARSGMRLRHLWRALELDRDVWCSGIWQLDFQSHKLLAGMCVKLWKQSTQIHNDSKHFLLPATPVTNTILKVIVFIYTYTLVSQYQKLLHCNSQQVIYVINTLWNFI